MHLYSERMQLNRLSEAVGGEFGTAHLAVWLSALISMQPPKVVVELGTGYGLSTFWMAFGVATNGLGMLYSVDNFDRFDNQQQRRQAQRVIEAVVTQLALPIDASCSADEYFTALAEATGVRGFVRLIKANIDLQDSQHFDNYPFASEMIDIVFSDFRHGPSDVIYLLAHFLPRMADSASILIHSASGSWTSFLLLEVICSQLNRGVVPKLLRDRCTKDLEVLVRTRRFVLIHLTEPTRQTQNSVAWIKIEPIDVLPHPEIIRAAANQKSN